MNDFLRPTDDAARPAIAVNLVLFTVADASQLERLEVLGLISGSRAYRLADNGLSLLVVTVRTPEKFFNPLRAGDTADRILPFGYVEGDETLVETARRIARRKLGISDPIRFRDGGIFDAPNRTPGRRVVAFPYWGFVALESIMQNLGGPDRVGLELVNSEYELERWGGMAESYDGISRFGARIRPDAKRGHNKVLSEDLIGHRILALDSDEMVFYSWRKLRHAVNGPLDPFRSLGVPFLGETFRLSELKAFHDVVRGELTQRDAFKRIVLNRDFVVESDVVDKSRRGKPTNLWKVSEPISEYLQSPPRDELLE